MDYNGSRGPRRVCCGNLELCKYTRFRQCRCLSLHGANFLRDLERDQRVNTVLIFITESTFHTRYNMYICVKISAFESPFLFEVAHGLTWQGSDRTLPHTKPTLLQWLA